MPAPTPTVGWQAYKPPSGIDYPTPTPSPLATPNPSVTPTVTPTSSVTPSAGGATLADALSLATTLVNERIRVQFGFDGQITTSEGGAGEVRRAVGWGADKSTFTWKRFLTLEDAYNPYSVAAGYPAGTLNPWSLVNWYKKGFRKFHFHNPFGKVVIGKPEQLVYQVDQFLICKEGLTSAGQIASTPMPWLTNDFVPVIRALTTGQRGTLDESTWNSWITGPNAWFNPSEPIDLVVYIGGMADPGIGQQGLEGYDAYVTRWNQLFLSNPKAAYRRLQQSVIPLIEAYCRVSFDAIVSSPGPVPGKDIPFSRQCRALQKGWWDMWKWLEGKIGKNRLYIESHPFKKNGEKSPYLGYNIIADDEWSYAPCCPPGPNGPHMTSEMGPVEFWRSIWQMSPARTPLVSTTSSDGVRTMGRYWFLDGDAASNNKRNGEIDPTAIEQRLQPASCCNSGHNYYWNHMWPSIIAYHLLEPQHTRGETNPKGNVTKAGIMIPPNLWQVLPESTPGDSNWYKQFGYRFVNKQSLINYIATIIDKRKRNETTAYSYL